MKRKKKKKKNPWPKGWPNQASFGPVLSSPFFSRLAFPARQGSKVVAAGLEEVPTRVLSEREGKGVWANPTSWW